MLPQRGPPAVRLSRQRPCARGPAAGLGEDADTRRRPPPAVRTGPVAFPSPVAAPSPDPVVAPCRRALLLASASFLKPAPPPPPPASRPPRRDSWAWGLAGRRRRTFGPAQAAARGRSLGRWRQHGKRGGGGGGGGGCEGAGGVRQHGTLRMGRGAAGCGDAPSACFAAGAEP